MSAIFSDLTETRKKIIWRKTNSCKRYKYFFFSKNTFIGRFLFVKLKIFGIPFPPKIRVPTVFSAARVFVYTLFWTNKHPHTHAHSQKVFSSLKHKYSKTMLCIVTVQMMFTVIVKLLIFYQFWLTECTFLNDVTQILPIIYLSPCERI